jgi:hypothetical protein
MTRLLTIVPGDFGLSSLLMKVPFFHRAVALLGSSGKVVLIH